MSYHFIGIHFTGLNVAINTGTVIAVSQCHLRITAVTRCDRLAPYIYSFNSDTVKTYEQARFVVIIVSCSVAGDFQVAFSGRTEHEHFPRHAFISIHINSRDPESSIRIIAYKTDARLPFIIYARV